MTHRSSGLYRLLAVPRIYEGFQKLLGARAARVRFVRDYLRPSPGCRLLDIGCGTGSLLDDLPLDVEYVGYDPNSSYIAAARRRYAGRGTFFCAAVGDDERALRERAPFDFVVAKSLFHHLSDADADRVVAMARRMLRQDGVFVSSDNVFYERQPWVSRALTALDRGKSVRSPEGYRRLVEPHFGVLETRLITDMLPIPYAHFIMRARASS